MSDNNAQNETRAPQDPYMSVEFEEFLKLIGESKLTTWTLYAKVLGVSKATISRWKQHPLARQAILQNIHESLEKMESSGANDWRMHREKLKMFGIEEEQTINVNKVSDVLDEIEKSNYDEFRSPTEIKAVENEQPVQDQGQGGEQSDVPPESNAAETPTGQGESPV